MGASKISKYWMLIIILLVAIIAVGGIVAWSRYGSSQSIEISMPPRQELQCAIYIGGAVINPGFYPIRVEESMEDVIQAAVSWLFLLFTVVTIVLTRPEVKLEERYCLGKYGSAYREYMDRTPRWIGIPR